MLLLFGFFLVLFGVTVILVMPMLWAREIHHQYAAPRAVICPETHRPVGVTIDATHAAATGLRGTPEFRLTDCTRWPARADCGQECLPDALHHEPYTEGEVHLPKSRDQIYHLPVLLGAFAAWYIGMVWHSGYLFRSRWIAALGLSTSQWKQLVLWYSPHLLSIAACLLFAYGVAWLQIWLPHRGLWPGILSSTILWAALLFVSLPSVLGLPRDLFLIEATYTLVAALAAGAIIGGLSGRMVLPPLKAS
jgi:hypothetical protein